MTAKIQNFSKITLATVKSFIRKNEALFILCKSSFDGMTDGVETIRGARFEPAVKTTRFVENTLGIEGAWVVGGSRNYFRPFISDEFVGIEVFNCCGSFVLAVKA